jgi:two-component system LytT family response regulator
MSEPRLRVVIVDDEAPARMLLRELLSAHADLEIVGECANGFEAVKAVSEHRPDLMLLDIQMPKLDGFEVLELMGDGPLVIFVTAYDEYAIRAFDVHAVDYLLKPFSANRLDEALERSRTRLRTRETTPVAEIVAAVRPRSERLERILIRDRGDVHVIPVDKIDFVESQDDYIAVKALGKTFLKDQTLADLETRLDAGRFVRIHRRFILNVSRLARIELSATDSRSAILTDGTELPISKAGYARLRELL